MPLHFGNFSFAHNILHIYIYHKINNNFFFLVDALYRHQHSEFINYLYLVAPINLIILNPFGFAMMELGQEYDRHETTRRSALMGRISRNIICNPVVFMTALGMIANLVFNHSPPKIITTFLGVSQLYY